MRLLTLDNQNVDLIMVQQKQLGIYSNLQIDMCGIIDRSVCNWPAVQSVCQSGTKLCPFTSPPQASALIMGTEFCPILIQQLNAGVIELTGQCKNSKGKQKL